MRRYSTCITCLLTISIALCASVIPTDNASASTLPDSSFPEETAILVNEFRAENGLEPLQLVPVLLDCSATRAVELQQSYGHIRPDGSDWFTIIESTDLDSNCYAAENVAAGFATPEEVVEAWKASDAHRTAMLGDKYQYIGVGISYIEDDPNYYNTYWDLIMISAETPPAGAWIPGEVAADTSTDSAVSATLLYQPVCGDLNCDQQISMADVVLLEQSLLQQVTLNTAQQASADCYADGFLDQMDSLALIRYLLRIVPTIPLSN